MAVETVVAVIRKLIGGVSADKPSGRLTFSMGRIVIALGVAALAALKTVMMFQATFSISSRETLLK